MTSDNKNKITYISQYKIIKTIAISGYSQVFLVEDTQNLNKQYALKAIKDSSEKYKLQNEINIYKKIRQHENILKLERVFHLSNKLFFLFEYTNEQDLEKQIELNGKFSEQKVLDVLKDMVKVLTYTHSLNIIHNDIKASNILSKKEKFYLCDWGLSINKKEDETLHIRSDEKFSAPEVFCGNFDSRCDIYSLGCSLFYLSTGKFIYDITKTSSYDYIMYAHYFLSPDVSSIKSNKLQYLIIQMTQKKAENRITLAGIVTLLNSDIKYSYKYAKVDYEFYKSKDSFELYSLLIEKNVLFAYNNLAFLYEIDEEKKDKKKAISLYTYAAKNGLIKAMYNLALCYYEVNDVEKNNSSAFYWFRQAALKNHEKAQYHLASYYEKGILVPKDMEKAISLYKVSANAGYIKAYHKLNNLNIK